MRKGNPPIVCTYECLVCRSYEAGGRTFPTCLCRDAFAVLASTAVGTRMIRWDLRVRAIPL